MSEMDWETTGPAFTPQPNAEQGQCPYRQSGDRPNNGNFPGAPPAGVVSFNLGQAPPQVFWDNIAQHNLPSHGGLNNRFPPIHANPHPPGRQSDPSSFDYHMGLESQSHSSVQPRNSRFEGNRPPIQQNRPYLNGTPGAAVTQAGLANSSIQSPPSSIDPGPNYSGGMARRTGAASTMSHENSIPQSIDSPSRHLPPPNSSYAGVFVPPFTPFPRQARFPPDMPVAGGSQNVNSAVPHSPPIPREAGWRAESGPQNAGHRNWFHEQFYSTQMTDLDSDEDSIEAQEEHLRRQGRLDPAATLQFLQESMRLTNQRRVNPPYDPDEMSLERVRAARRAAAAAVKFVASPSALAALEKVDLDSLAGADRSCIICYNEFGLKNPDGFVEIPVRLPKCKHVFGDRCLKQWLQDSDSCPYCRDKLPSEPKRNQSGDDVRRIFAQSRTPGIDLAAEAARSYADPVAAAAERERQYQQLVQHRLRQRDDGPEELLARIRRRDEYDWGPSSHQTAAMGLPGRSIVDYDGRRRYRGRHNVSRTASQTANRTNGLSSARSSRTPNLQAGPMRTPAHSSTPSFDENSTSQRRSVTPHPTITGHPAWPSPPQIQPAAASRPSSLPTERSPLGEASDVRPDAMDSRTSSGSSTNSNPLDRPWSDNNGHSAGAYMGWMIPTSNGRPASATFINEMPPARLQQLHDDFQNNRLPPYLSNPNDAAFNNQTGNLNRRQL